MIKGSVLSAKKYLTFFRIQFSGGLQYRAAALGGIITQFAWGSMSLLLYTAFYKTNAGAFPMSFEALSSYIWMQQAFLGLFMIWFMDNELFNLIRSGNVAYELVRPVGLYSMWFIKNAAGRLVKTVLRCFPILIVAVLLPAPYSISPPESMGVFFIFLLSLVLAYMVVNAFCMLIYIATFFTINSMGIRIIALSLTEFLAGGVVPLPFFPDGIRQAVELTPFASMQNLPLRIYGGDIEGSGIIYGMLLQVFWLGFLLFTGKLLMNKALRKTVVQGG
jgi:ABC-2 type transport system permease protein